jgi:predicted dehydrogenase
LIRVGIAGIGFMGMMHYLAYQRAKGIKVVAIASRDAKKRSGDWRGIQGNFGPAGEIMDLAGVRGYETLPEMLADSRIDLIDLCTPPAAHAEGTIASLQVGKHVLCEKPIAVSLKDAERMVRSSQQAGKRLFIGQVLPFFPAYAFVHKAATSGKYGRLLGGSFKRIISDPLWLKDFWDADAVGGPLIDLHIHDAHFIRLLFGMPEAVFTSGRTRGELLEFFQTQFLYPGSNVQVSATSGALAQQGRSFTNGFEIHFEKATMLFDLAVIGGKAELSMPLTVLTDRGKVERPTLPEGDDITGFAAEITEVARAIRTNQPSPVLEGELARDALLLCHRQAESAKKGAKVRV